MSPSSRPLEDGDVVNIDVTVYLNGYHGDTSRTFLVGDVVSDYFFSTANAPYRLFQDEAGRNLVNATSEALEAGIAVCGPGKPFKSIGNAIQDVADQRGFSVSNQFTGHGIGNVFHRSPWILHHRES
jgi:methionyl aminopeptidase